MTIDELKRLIEEIRESADDDEMAHAAEARLRARVLEHIANGGDNARELAQLVLTTSDIEFCRWCS